MAGGIVTTTRQLLLQYFGGKASLTQPAAWFISLHTANPGDSTTGASEVSTSGTAYARAAINAIGGSNPNWRDATSASPSVLSNEDIVSYATATGAGFGTVTHFGIHTHVSNAAAMIAYGALTGSVAVGVGVTASFAVDALTLTMDHT